MPDRRIKLVFTPQQAQALLGLDSARYRVYGFAAVSDPPSVAIYVESPEFEPIPIEVETPTGSLNHDGSTPTTP